MSDLWSDLGGGHSEPLSEQWLYRKNGQLHGPVPKEVIIQHLLQGELTPDSMVAREGGNDFHPVRKVKTFKSQMGAVAEGIINRKKRKRNLLFLAALAIGSLLVFGAYLYFDKLKKKRIAEENARILLENQKIEEENRKKALSIKKNEVAVMRLIEIKEEEIVIADNSASTNKKVNTKRKNNKKKNGKTTPGGPNVKTERGSDGSSTTVCSRSKSEMKSGLGQKLKYIGACVSNESQRVGESNLPNKLNIAYVIMPDGRVVDIGIKNRGLRTGPLNNCMTKVLRTIKYKKVGGAACTVNIPIGTGKK